MMNSGDAVVARPAMAGAIAVLAAAMILAGCDDGRNKPASQTAAKVNGEEITVHQINFVLQQQRGLRSEQAEAAKAQILERLIDQELAIQKAENLKIDREPRVVQQIEAAKREIIARAWADKVAQAASVPSAQDIQKYFDDKPALFKERRIYNLQEIAVEARPDQVEALRTKLESAKNVNEFVDYLKANDFRFGGSHAVRAAEQLPLTRLDQFAKMSDGQALLMPTPTGAHVVTLISSRSQPVDLKRASPAIEQFLLNERKRELIERDRDALRATARIEYEGDFQQPAGKVGTTPALAASTVAPVQGPSGLDAEALSKGLKGLKQ